MSLDTDTQLLRNLLHDVGFHREFAQRWVAVRDGRVERSFLERTAMDRWLADEDREGRCVVAFADPRPFA